MKSDVETLSPTRKKLSIEVPFDEFKPSLDKAYKDISQQISIPGFRKGKVPPAIINQRVGVGAVAQEAMNDALPKFYGKSVDEAEIVPVGEPDVEVTDIPDPTKGGEFKFTVEVDVRPDLTIPDFKDISVEVEEVTADESDVEERMTELRQRFATLVGVDRPAAKGDFVSLNLKAAIDGEEIDTADGISYEVGSGNMLEGIDEALDGLSAEDTTTFTAPLRGGEHAGKDAEISIEVLTVKERELPELDDEFAELASEFDTLDELKEDLAKQSEEQAKIMRISKAQELFLDKLVEVMEVPVPQALIDAEVKGQLEREGVEEDSSRREELAKEAEPAIARQLIMDALARDIDVQVTNDELINHIVTVAPQYGMDPQSFATMLENSGQIPSLVQDVGRRKALLLCLADADIKDADGNAVDLGLVEDDETEEDAAEPATDADAESKDETVDAKAEEESAKA